VTDGYVRKSTEGRAEEASGGLLPLAGIRVVDFSWLMPGPWASQTLGDLGADVIKIERKGTPDPSRFNAPHYREGTVYFHSVNRNKRSIALDLNDGEDARIARELIARADVLIESFRPNVTTRLKVDYGTVSALNPRIIYCSVTGFGSTGELAATPGHDASLQGLAGILDGGESQDIPLMPRVQTADWAAASFAVIGILGALHRRQITNLGMHIEASIYDSVLSWSNNKLSSALARVAGQSGMPALESFGTNPRYSTYRTRDGKAVTLSVLEAKSWAHLCEIMGRLDLIDNNETAADRHMTHPTLGAQYRAALEAFFGAHARDELVAWMTKEGIAVAPVLNPDEAVSYAMKRGAIDFIDHPREGPVPYFVDPLARSGLSNPGRRPAPAFDQHGDEIRAELTEGAGVWGHTGRGAQ